MIPPPPETVGGDFHKFAQRKAMELPIVAAGVLIRTDNGVLDLVRIALGAVAKKPFQARRAGKTLVGQEISRELLRHI